MKIESLSSFSKLRQVLTCGIVGFALSLFAHPANAQNATNQILSNITGNDIGRGYSIDSINQLTLGVDRGRVAGNIGTSVGVNGGVNVSKPFANKRPRSTVSPYLNLFNDGLNEAGDNYTTLVRPLLNQQRTNEQFRRQNTQNALRAQSANARFQSLSARPAFSVTGNQNIFSTGHRVLYNNTMNFYPAR